MITKVIELSPAELEMINLKREQEALAQKEKAAKEALQLEKDIADKKAYIAKVIKEDAAQVKAVRDFNVEFDNQYSIEVKTWDETANILGSYIDMDNSMDRHILWTEEFQRQSATIVHKGGYRIQVSEQIVYTNRFSSRGTSKGFKMYIDGPGIDYLKSAKAYARVSTVMEKIKEAQDKVQAEIDYKNKQKSSLQTTVYKFKAEYPDADVTTDRGYEIAHGRRYSEGTSYDMVRVKFVNGAQIAYKVYADGSLSRVSFNLPGYKDEAAFMKNLSQMKF